MSSLKLVTFMIAAAVAVASLVYVFTGSIKWALGIAGLCLAVDLTFAPWIKQKIREMNDRSDKGD